MRRTPWSLQVFVIFSVLFIASLIQPVMAAATYYVSMSGDDSASGAIAAPFRTIQRAANIMVAGDVCIIRAGTYRETVKPVNSGTSETARITYKNFPGERVIISGADLLSNASIVQHQGSIYKVAMSWSINKSCNQIFMNRVMQPEGRFPNKAEAGLEYPVPLPASVWPPRGVFHAAPTPSTQITGNLLNGNSPNQWIEGLYAGTHYTGFQYIVADITGSGSGFITVPTLDPGSNGEPEHGRGYIFGVLSTVDTAGEWAWYNKFLYYRAPQGVDPTKITFEAKKRWYAFDLTGKSFITLRNLEVISAGLYLWQSSNCLIDSARMSYMTEYRGKQTGTPDMTNGIYIGGHHNTVQNSILEYSAGSAIRLTGLYHKVTNNIIRNVGYSGDGSPGIQIGPETKLENTQLVIPDPTDRGGHEVSYNKIYNCARAAINVGRDVMYTFMTGRGATPPVRWGLPTPFRKMLIHHNELFNGNILTMDCGLFYTNGTDGGGTEIHHNVIYNDLQIGTRGNGVYLDNNSFGFQIHHNIIWIDRVGGWRNAFMANEPGGKINAEVPGDVSIWIPPDMTKAPYPQGTERRFYSNTFKRNYTGGVAGLTDADFPGGRFAFGTNLSLPALEIQRGESHAISIRTEPLRMEHRAGRLRLVLSPQIPYTLRVYDLPGRKILEQKGKGGVEFQVGNKLNTGVYLARVTAGKASANIRFMVMK